MKENLNIGTLIENNTNQTDNDVIEKYCYDCNTYGGLYMWDEMMQYSSTPGVQGICPLGWHLPTDLNWCILEQTVDNTIFCYTGDWRGIDGGGKLKETGTIHWTPPNAGATNSSGFTALPGGLIDPGGYTYNQGNGGYYWTSSESGVSAWFRAWL